jgi:predicted nucleic acid-binding protein
MEQGSVPLREQPKKIRLQLSSQARRFVQRDAPREVRLMASKGALPLPPIEIASVLFALMHDRDPEVKSTARDSLEGLPETVCDAVLSGPAHAAVLSHLARTFAEDEAKLEMLALNSATDDGTIAFLASIPFRRVVEIVSRNQDRLLRAPEIVEALGNNPLTGRAVIERILSFLGIESVPAGGREHAEAAAEPAHISDEEAEAALRAVLGDDFGHMAREFVRENDEEVEPDATSNLYGLIQNMSVMQKIKLARMGNKEARGLLVRDRNKIVAISAISSPKVTLQEVVTVAKARNVSDEVLRVIARNRDWTRDYQVKLGLATNPKCARPEAMKFVNYLQDRDLRALMRSKDVPTAISTHARRILMKKGKI